MAKFIDNIKNVFTRKEKQQLTDGISLVNIMDRYSTYPSKGLTPSKLASLLREADGGDVYRQMELFEEMLEKDAHLQALFQARRLAVTRRNYSIIAASEEPRAKEIRDGVDKMIKRIRGWNNVTGDMLDCVPKGFSVCELQWGFRNNLLEIQNVKYLHQKKFRFGKVSDPYSDNEELRLIIDATQAGSFAGLVPPNEISLASTDGVAINGNPTLKLRFIPLFCKARSGNPARTALLRTLTFLFLFKNYDVKWWISFAEGMLGYRIGKYDTSAADADKQKELLEQAVQGLSTDSSAVISKDSLIEFVELAGKASSHQVYGEFKDWCNAEMSTLVLGHTGSSTSTPGKLGSEDAAKEVKQEIVEADAKILDEAITDYIIKPYVDLNYGPQNEYPYYQTDLSQSVDLNEEASIGIKLQQMGAKFQAKTIKEKFGWQLANNDEEVLVPQQNMQPGFPGATVTAKDDVSADSKKKNPIESPIDDNYESQLEVVTQNTIDDAVEIYQPLVAKFVAILESSNNFDAAQTAVESLDTSDFQKELSPHLLNALEVGNALGRSLIIKTNESFNSEPIAAKDLSEDWFVCDDGPVSVSFNVIPKDVLDELKKKAIELSGVESDDLKNAVKAKIEEAVVNGKTLDEFRQELNSIFDSMGVTKLSKQRIDLVFRMNIYSAYSVGKAQQVAGMIEQFPLAFYSPIMDQRSRHRDLRGYYPSDKVPLPPVDYNCRCSVRYIHKSQITGNEQPIFDRVTKPDLIVFHQRDSM